MIAFVGKEAYRGAFDERPELGLQRRKLGDDAPLRPSLRLRPRTPPFRTPSGCAGSGARTTGSSRSRQSGRARARAIVLDPDDRILLVHFRRPRPAREPGGPRRAAALDEGETRRGGAAPRAARGERGSPRELGPCMWTREHVFDWAAHYIRQVERYYVVRVDSAEVAPQIDLAAEDVHELRWWTLAELAASQEQFAPRRLRRARPRAARGRAARGADRRAASRKGSARRPRGSRPVSRARGSGRHPGARRAQRRE